MWQITSDYRERSRYVAGAQGAAGVGLLDSAYANDWARFIAWCETRKFAPIVAQPEVVAQFLEAETAHGYSFKTISHRLAAIGYMHRRNRVLPPLLQKGGSAIRAALARIASDQVSPHSLQATTTILRSILETIYDDTLEAARDRALFALKIAGAFQMSELAALTLSKIEWQDRQLKILLGGGDPGSGRRCALTIIDDTVFRPVKLLEDWLAQSKIQNGPLFRHVYEGTLCSPMTKHDVSEAIQLRALAAGYDGDMLVRIKARKSAVHSSWI
jgi:site-specific recombinase XerC